MSGKNSDLTPLETRKQLLLIESEINRAQFAREWAELRGEIRLWKQQMNSLSTTASSVFNGVKVVGTVLARGKSSLASTLFNVARSGLSMWGKALTRVR